MGPLILCRLSEKRVQVIGLHSADQIKTETPTAPVLESMRAREPSLQAPSNLAGSKTKNTHMFWSIDFFLKVKVKDYKLFTGSKSFKVVRFRII